jgi:hypothetical protein
MTKEAFCKAFLTSVSIPNQLKITVPTLITMLRKELIRRGQLSKSSTDISITIYTSENNKVLNGGRVG